MAKVFIVDEQPMYRQGIRAALGRMADVEIAGDADLTEAILAPIDSVMPDVVIMGADTAFAECLRLCRAVKVRAPSVSIIVLSGDGQQDEQAFQAIKAQASAFLGRNVSPDELSRAIARCARGEHPINETLATRPRVAEQILKQFHELSREKETASFMSPLTPKEMEVLQYMAQGFLNKQIADKLDVTEQTIKNHITSILRKLNANARTQAVVIAIKKGLVVLTKD
ncbi:MAG: response regulator transcription factor [Dehalococcoidia bacterium]|jgi:DNA-binding NarL/FixJ family response regulator|nr:response regulator transcription factor [Dehalococcoidia bacterium]